MGHNSKVPIRIYDRYLRIILRFAKCGPSCEGRGKWIIDYGIFQFRPTLIQMNFNFKSLFAIWSLSPQKYHYYFYLSMVSWQYQKYSTILTLVVCLLCVTPLVCSSYTSFAPSSPFFSSWWQKDFELFTHTLVLQCSPSTSSCQPQATHVFADSRIGLLCHVLCICVARAPPEPCPSFLPVH